MKVLDLFSGIGAFSLGLERAGMETIAFCEIEDYPVKILNKHWPDVPIYEDVRELTNEKLKADGITGIDVICGGFPCQDISCAGNQAGIGEETRSGLWSECARLLRDIRPKYAIFENVTALLNGAGGDWFKRVLWDISQVGYDAEWHCIPASELGAHHHRDRIWIIAYPKHNGHPAEQELRSNETSSNNRGQERQKVSREPEGENRSIDVSSLRGSNSRSPQRHCETSGDRAEENKNVSNSISKRQQGQGQHEQSLFTKAYGEGQSINAFPGGSPDIWKTESKLGRVANGPPDRVARLKALGNAVVPQIPEIIGRAILEVENKK